eukprot:g13798.t1
MVYQLLSALTLLQLSTSSVAQNNGGGGQSNGGGPSGFRTCSDQHKCIDIVVTEVENGSCTSGCEFEACITIDVTQDGCAKDGEISHICGETSDNVPDICSWLPVEIEGVSSPNTQCQLGTADEELTFIFKDGSGCDDVLSGAPNIGPGAVSCRGRNADDASCTGGGNVGKECVWTVKLPAQCGGDMMTGDPHMKGLRGQKIDWSGVDGGWYSMIKDDDAELDINLRLTAPLPDEFPDRQLITGLSVLSEGRSLVIEVENPYTIDTDGCPEGVSPCLANGGLSIIVDGQKADELLRFSTQVPVADGAISLSASNLPVECRQFGGDKIWASMYEEMVEVRRQLLSAESLEDWILRYDQMAAPEWCAKYIAENELADLQSIHAIFRIETPTITVRLNAGVNYQGGDGELDWDGRVLPDLEFWQMDVGLDGLDIKNPALSGILGETARPVYDESGQMVMEGFEAFRGTVEDYRVSGALGVHFALLD